MTRHSTMMIRERERILDGASAEERAAMLARRLPADDPLPPRVPAGGDASAAGLGRRRAMLHKQGIVVDSLAEHGGQPCPEDLAGNIESFVGFTGMPVGVIGPLRVNGVNAHGDFYVPMATTEGALVASCQRGACVVSQSGGCSTLCLAEAVSRAPCFVFRDMAESGVFLAWLLVQLDKLQEIVDGTSRYCRFVDLRSSVMGKELYLIFDFTTGDASGQNMVTFATEAICNYIVEHAPVKPVRWYLESNMSGDKKATMIAFNHVRGKKVVAEAIVQKRLLRHILHTDPEEMVRYWQVSFMGGTLSGAIGSQGHLANSLTAMFAACGQDVACISEASVGMTRMDLTAEGDLYVSVSLPNLIVGTVGGGTWLPTARECLKMMDCCGEGRARKLAEICAATALAGEVSLIGALAAGEFGEAHAAYGRHKGSRQE